MNSFVTKRSLNEGYELVWATPTGGFGHPADEQPIPHVRHNGHALTPRYGGDQSQGSAGWHSIPLPQGLLSASWPITQRLFNLPRRRINLYWRNGFSSVCRKDGWFLFAEQLSYRTLDSGFRGSCPLISFKRCFTCDNERLSVSDHIIFKKPLSFSRFRLPYLHGSQVVTLTGSNVELFNTNTPNISLISSSTGSWRLSWLECKDPSFHAGSELVFKAALDLKQIRGER